MKPSPASRAAKAFETTPESGASASEALPAPSALRGSGIRSRCPVAAAEAEPAEHSSAVPTAIATTRLIGQTYMGRRVVEPTNPVAGRAGNYLQGSSD